MTGRAALALAALGVACAVRTPTASAPASAEELLAPYAAVRLGVPVSDLMPALPALAPTGWSSGDRVAYLDAGHEAGLEVVTRAGRVEAVSLTFSGERAREVARELGGRLGAGQACGGLPEAAGAFVPRLHRLTDGAGVTVLDKGGQVSLHVARPPTPAFETAFAACAPDAGAPRP